MNNFSNFDFVNSFENEPKVVNIDFDVVIGDIVEDYDGYYDFLKLEKHHFNITSYDDEVKRTINDMIRVLQYKAEEKYECFDIDVRTENVKITC